MYSTPMRIALLADIHGNLPALEAVLQQLEAEQPDYVVLDGDLINGVPFSTAVIDCVRQRDWVVVRGNHEFYYLDFGTTRALPGNDDPDRWGQLHWLVEQITPAQGNYLAMLPDERTFYLPGTQPLRIAHGVPGRNRVGFYTGQPEAQIAAEIQEVTEPTLISAHTHLQIDRHIRLEVDRAHALQMDPHADHQKSQLGNAYGEVHRHWHVINPGSVGLPLGGEPTAQYAIIESVPENHTPGGWHTTHYRLPYDRRPALAAFAESGMLTAGGVITQLFYWEVVTAEPEIVLFYRWAWDNGYDPDGAINGAFQAYINTTGRGAYVRARDPLFQRGGA